MKENRIHQPYRAQIINSTKDNHRIPINLPDHPNKEFMKIFVGCNGVCCKSKRNAYSQFNPEVPK